MTDSNRIWASGIIKMLGYSFFFSVMAVFIKLLSVTMTTPEIIFWRCCIPLPLLLFMIRKRSLSLKPRNSKMMALRVFFSALSMGATFLSLKLLPIADAVLIGRTQPIFIALLAPLLLGEKGDAKILGIIAFSLLGVVLVLEPTIAVGNLGGIIALLGALISACAHMAVRKLSKSEDPLVIVTILSVSIAFLASPLALPKIQFMDSSVWPHLLGLATVSTIAQLLMTMGYRAEIAPAASAATYSSVFFAMIWGVVFWKQVPSLNVGIGSMMIAGAGLLLIWVRYNHFSSFQVKS